MIPNFLSILLIALVALIHSEVYYLTGSLLWASFGVILSIGIGVSAYLWRSLSLPRQEFFKYALLNSLVALFWLMLLIL